MEPPGVGRLVGVVDHPLEVGGEPIGERDGRVGDHSPVSCCRPGGPRLGAAPCAPPGK